MRIKGLLVIALSTAFTVCGSGYASAQSSSSHGYSSGSSRGYSHGGGHGFGGIGTAIGIGLAVGNALSEAPPPPPPRSEGRGESHSGRPERHAKPAPVPEEAHEACSEEDKVPILPVSEWDRVKRRIPELVSLRYPGGDKLLKEYNRKDDELYVVFDEGKIRCIAGAWNLRVYYHLKGLPWPYDKQPKALTGKQLSDYSPDEVDKAAPLIKPQDGPRFGLTPEDMIKLAECSKREKILDIFRASTPASAQHHNNPSYMPKPPEYYVTAEKTKTLDNSGLIHRLKEQRDALRAELAEQSAALPDVHPRIKELKEQIEDLDRQIKDAATPRSTAQMHSDKKTGIILDENGKPLVIDGKIVFADLDPQGRFQRGSNGNYEEAWGEKTYVASINSCVGYVLATHSGENNYRGRPEPPSDTTKFADQSSWQIPPR